MTPSTDKALQNKPTVKWLAWLLGSYTMPDPFSISTYLLFFPMLMVSLGETQLELQQTLSAYLAAFEVMMLLHGPLRRIRTPSGHPGRTSRLLRSVHWRGIGQFSWSVDLFPYIPGVLSGSGQRRRACSSHSRSTRGTCSSKTARAGDLERVHPSLSKMPP